MRPITYYILISFLLFPAFSMAQEEACMHSSAGSITPAGIMGSHTHHKGSWMFSYHFMQMNMKGNLQGTERIPQQDILEQYMMAPQTMDMQMHMLGAMYAINDQLTLMAMVPFLRNQMQMEDRMGMASEMHSSHLGDISLSAMYSLMKKHRQSLQLNMGLGLPTGSIDEMGSMKHMHHNMEMCLPYLMQTGSGTPSLMPALTYMAIRKSFSLGAQASARLPLGENQRAYHQGQLFILNTWAGYQQNSWLAYSLRLQGMKNLKLVGQDAEMNPMMSPTADASNSGSKLLSGFIGASLKVPKGALKGQQLALEYGLPLYQEVNGIQMQDKGSLIASWQMSF